LFEAIKVAQDEARFDWLTRERGATISVHPASRRGGRDFSLPYTSIYVLISAGHHCMQMARASLARLTANGTSSGEGERTFCSRHRVDLED